MHISFKNWIWICVYISEELFFQEDQCCPNMATAIKPSKISDMTSKKIY